MKILAEKERWLYDDVQLIFWSEKSQGSGRAWIRVTVLLEFNTYKNQG